jgi:hypothetical protein
MLAWHSAKEMFFAYILYQQQEEPNCFGGHFTVP